MDDEANQGSDSQGGDDDRYLTCRNLLFREGRDESEPAVACADMCRTPVGLIALLDCPVWIGRHCRFFAPREAEPEPLIEADLDDLREGFRRDYMRWRYWRRVRDLREPPVEDAPVPEDEAVPGTHGVHEIPARPEAAAAGHRKQRFPGDAPSGPPPKPVEEVDLDHLPALLPGPVEVDEAPAPAPAEAEDLDAAGDVNVPEEVSVDEDEDEKESGS